MNLLVIGASRGIGSLVVNRALQQDWNVLGLSRSPLAQTHPNLIHQQGDTLDPTFVKASLTWENKPVDAVVQCLGVPFNLQMITGPVTLFSEATEVLIPAMQEIGVKRLLTVTGFGAGQCAAAIHWTQRLGFAMVFGRAYADKSKQEAMIENSSLDWTIARPGVLTNSRRTDCKVLTEPAEWRNGMVSRRAVAQCLVDEVSRAQLIGKSPVLVQ